MTETAAPPEFDMSSLSADDAPPLTDTVTPDYRASRDNRAKSWRQRRKDERAAREQPRARTVKAKSSIPNRKGQFKDPLTEFYTGVGLIMMPFDSVCGSAFVSSAERCAETIDELAYRNEVVRRMVHAFISTSMMGAVFFAHLPILLAVAMHHVPALKNALGNVPAEMIQQIVTNLAAAQNVKSDDEPADAEPVNNAA